MSFAWHAQPVLDHYRVQRDVSPADWLAPRLSTPPYRRVNGLLPSGLSPMPGFCTLPATVTAGCCGGVKWPRSAATASTR